MNPIPNGSHNLQKRIRSWLCLILLLDLFAFPSRAHACSCIGSSSPASELDSADAAFIGDVTRIIDMKDLGTSRPDPSSFKIYGYRVYFAVIRSWKGISTSTAVISTGYGEGDCGYEFQLGARYLVYAYGESNNLGVGICSRTIGISEATDDLAFLNTVAPVFDTAATSSAWLQFFLVAVSVMSILLFAFRRRRSRTPHHG